jgi:uncharacterized protein YoaH (UPF0181 family)
VGGTGQVDADLVDHLTRTSPLSRGEAVRVVAEVLGYFSEPAEAFVRRRHRELRAQGLKNEQAFARIAAELPLRRVAPPRLSLRQIRRIVYG